MQSVLWSHSTLRGLFKAQPLEISGSGSISLKTLEFLQQVGGGEVDMADLKDLNIRDYLFNVVAPDSTDKIADEDEHVKNIIVNESEKMARIITDVYNNNQVLYNLSSREFEEMIAELLKRQGYEVHLTKQTRDNGYDILGFLHHFGHTPMKLLVECKRYKENKVGVEIIRSFKEVIQTEKANKGIIVTTSFFSKDAKKKQIESPYMLDLRDKDDVIKWVSDSRNP